MRLGEGPYIMLSIIPTVRLLRCASASGGRTRNVAEKQRPLCSGWS